MPEHNNGLFVLSDEAYSSGSIKKTNAKEDEEEGEEEAREELNLIKRQRLRASKKKCFASGERQVNKLNVYLPWFSRSDQSAAAAAAALLERPVNKQETLNELNTSHWPLSLLSLGLPLWLYKATSWHANEWTWKKLESSAAIDAKNTHKTDKQASCVIEDKLSRHSFYLRCHLSAHYDSNQLQWDVILINSQTMEAKKLSPPKNHESAATRFQCRHLGLTCDKAAAAAPTTITEPEMMNDECSLWWTWS